MFDLPTQIYTEPGTDLYNTEKKFEGGLNNDMNIGSEKTIWTVLESYMGFLQKLCQNSVSIFKMENASIIMVGKNCRLSLRF